MRTGYFYSLVFALLTSASIAAIAAPATAWVLELEPRRLLPPGGDAIALSQQDVTVLHVLMAEPERIVSRQQIVQSLGENFLCYDQRRLDTQISRLRRKAEQATGMILPINTARNAGYRFYADAQVRP